MLSCVKQGFPFTIDGVKLKTRIHIFYVRTLTGVCYLEVTLKTQEVTNCQVILFHTV